MHVIAYIRRASKHTFTGQLGKALLLTDTACTRCNLQQAEPSRQRSKPVWVAELSVRRRRLQLISCTLLRTVWFRQRVENSVATSA